MNEPNPEDVAHAFHERAGGVCWCGRDRFTSVHVAEPDEVEQLFQVIEDELDQMRASSTAISVAVERLRGAFL